MRLGARQAKRCSHCSQKAEQSGGRSVVKRCASVMQMKDPNNFQSPLMPVLELEQALQTLSTDAEKAKMQKKVQDVKVHVSNLREYMIQT